MNFLDLLRLLKKLGPKAGEAFVIIERIVADVTELLALFKTEQTGRIYTAEDSSAEAEALLEELCSAELPAGIYGAMDGSHIKKALQFVKDNPQLLSVLLLLL